MKTVSIRRAARDAIGRTTEPTGRTAVALRALARRERLLWAAVAFAFVGDLLLTNYGLSLGLTEQNPVAASTLAVHGWAGMVALKLPATAIALGWRVVLPSVYRGFVPLLLALPWLVAVGINAGVILVVA